MEPQPTYTTSFNDSQMPSWSNITSNVLYEETDYVRCVAWSDHGKCDAGAMWQILGGFSDEFGKGLVFECLSCGRVEHRRWNPYKGFK